MGYVNCLIIKQSKYYIKCENPNLNNDILRQKFNIKFTATNNDETKVNHTK